MRTGPPPYEIADPKDWSQLAEPLRSRLWTARADCMAQNPTWAPLGLNSGKRTDWMQYQIRKGRVPAGQEWNPAYPGVPLTAIPGRSRHRNLSFDISAADLYRGLALDWLHRNGWRYGVHFPISSEYWHVQPTGATTTATIRPYGATNTGALTMSQYEDLKKLIAAEAKLRTEGDDKLRAEGFQQAMAQLGADRTRDDRLNSHDSDISALGLSSYAEDTRQNQRIGVLEKLRNIGKG